MKETGYANLGKKGLSIPATQDAWTSYLIVLCGRVGADS